MIEPILQAGASIRCHGFPFVYFAKEVTTAIGTESLRFKYR